jgi:hypothetical protein
LVVREAFFKQSMMEITGKMPLQRGRGTGVRRDSESYDCCNTKNSDAADDEAIRIVLEVLHCFPYATESKQGDITNAAKRRLHCDTHGGSPKRRDPPPRREDESRGG